MLNEKLKRTSLKFGRKAVSKAQGSAICNLLRYFTPLNLVLGLSGFFAVFQVYLFTFYAENLDKNRSVHVHSLRRSERNEGNSSELEMWLRENENTPAARFVQLLRRYLHDQPDAEANRIRACCNQVTSLDRCADIVPIKDKTERKGVGSTKNRAWCLGGTANYLQAERQRDLKDNPEELERFTHMPLIDSSNFTVWHLRRYAQNKELIYKLGTDAVCLPLILAGASIQDFGVAVELGPFLGFTSRCLGLGLNTTRRAHAFYAFDSFDGRENYNAISHSLPWVKEYNQSFTPQNSNFVWLWNMAMQDVYPTAHAHAGWINAANVNAQHWNRQPIAFLGIDSVKNWVHWKSQFEGFQSPLLLKGSIFAAMDFLFTDQPHIYYGCLRSFLLPVYSSFCAAEHWIFIVLKDIYQNDIQKCMSDLVSARGGFPSQESIYAMIQHMNQDLLFLRNLSPTKIDGESMRGEMKCLQGVLTSMLSVNSEKWKRFQL